LKHTPNLKRSLCFKKPGHGSIKGSLPFFVCAVRTVTVLKGTYYSLMPVLLCPVRFWLWRKAPADYRYFNRVLDDLAYCTSVGWWWLL